MPRCILVLNIILSTFKAQWLFPQLLVFPLNIAIFTADPIVGPLKV